MKQVNFRISDELADRLDSLRRETESWPAFVTRIVETMEGVANLSVCYTPGGGDESNAQVQALADRVAALEEWRKSFSVNDVANRSTCYTPADDGKLTTDKPKATDAELIELLKAGMKNVDICARYAVGENRLAKLRKSLKSTQTQVDAMD